MLLDITFHIVNLILALTATAVVIMAIFRTKKGLDMAFKFFLGTTVTLALAAIMQINQYIGVIPFSYEQIIFTASRLLASLFFLLGLAVMLHIISKESR
jgi:hypothetical protein